jgi:DNA-binding transcriptional ArsR family regulator
MGLVLKTCEQKKRLKDTVGFLKVVSDENRLKILCLLNKGEMCVFEIWENLELPQNLVSHHLRVLKDFKLVDSRREKRRVIYLVNRREIRKFTDFLSYYLK